MKPLLLAVALLVLLSMTASSKPAPQTSPACPYDKGFPTVECIPGRTHPVAECVCDGPAGPCHWVWKCVLNN